MADPIDPGVMRPLGVEIRRSRTRRLLSDKNVQTVLRLALMIGAIALLLVAGQAKPASADVPVAQDLSSQPEAAIQFPASELASNSLESQSAPLESKPVPAAVSKPAVAQPVVPALYYVTPAESNLLNNPLLDGPAPQPPVPNQGGTCISGYIINSYHETVGTGWEVTVKHTDGTSKTTTTDADGRFAFVDLKGGTWQVEVKIPDGWRPFTPPSFPVTLSGEGKGCADVRFKLEALSCIQVIKLDAGGYGDFEEMLGIPGWTMTATQGKTTLKNTTDGQGLTYFYNLPPGEWIITEEDKVGWRPAEGYDNAQAITLVPPHWPGTCEKVIFVNEQVYDSCIKVTKYDVAGNPVVGWTVNLTRDDGTQPPAAGVTGGDGVVQFNDLPLGAWTVTEVVQDWWRPVGPTSQQVVLEQPGACQEIRFVNEPLGCVDGYKINDLEEGLGGWTIRARNVDTGEEKSTVTDEWGYFSFKDLSIGTWEMSEELQEGWEAVTPSEFQVKVNQPFVCEHVRFKNRTRYACVDVFKRDHVDGIGLPGWTITLQPAYGGEPITGTTDGQGWVRFNELPPGIYTIGEAVQQGWVPVSPAATTVELYASGKCTVINFENVQEHLVPPPDHHKPPKPPKDHGPRYCPAWYTVKHGDTLWSISRWFNTPVNAIARVNHIKNPSLIYTGTRLCIPVGDP